MLDVWRIRVERLPRDRLPLVWVKLNSWLEVAMVLSTGEPTTCIGERVAQDLQRLAPVPSGRRVIPSDAGRVIARTVRLRSVVIPTIAGGPLEFAPWTVAVSPRPEVLRVGGLIGVDILATFQRLTYEFESEAHQAAPRDTLIVERSS